MKRLLILAVLCFAAAGAHAEKADSNKPTTIEADTLDFDDVNQIHVLTGNVQLRRGTLALLAEKATIRQSPEGWQSATLYSGGGQPATFRQKRDGGTDLWVEGRAERIEYDEKNEMVKMFEKANIKQLDGQRVTHDVGGEFISYDSRKEVFAVRNDASGVNKPGKGRVTLVIAPRNPAPAPSKAPAPAKERK